MTLSRRQFLTASIIAGAGFIGIGAGRATAAPGRPVLTRVLDYSANVPSAASIKRAGFSGAVRYVSAPRPGAEWMNAKPIRRPEAEDFATHGLAVASVYQFGVGETADWKTGAAGATKHVPMAIDFHVRAGGPTGRPIYMAVDANPSRWEYDNQIKPFLEEANRLLTAKGYVLGVYGNYNVIDWCVADGLGSYYWMHDWGSQGRVHPHAQIHQLPGNQQTTVDGIVCDINEVFDRDWGQWTPGQATTRPVDEHVSLTTDVPDNTTGAGTTTADTRPPAGTRPSAGGLDISQLGELAGMTPEDAAALEDIVPTIQQIFGSVSRLSS